MARYVKKPLVIEAIQYTGENFDELRQWADEQYCPYERIRAIMWRWPEVNNGVIVLPSELGSLACNPTDMIIYEPSKEMFYVMPVGIFLERYDPIEAAGPKLSDGIFAKA